MLLFLNALIVGRNSPRLVDRKSYSLFTSAAGSLAHNTATGLKPVIEPLLDAASPDAWYLFAGNDQVDRVEVTFKTGQRKPVTRQSLDFQTLSQTIIVLQSFAAKALRHRGMQKSNG